MALVEEKSKIEIAGEKLTNVDSHGDVLLPELHKSTGANNAVKFQRKHVPDNHNNPYCSINEAQESGFDLINNNSRINDSARLFTNPFAEMDMELDTGVPLYKTLLGRTEINLVARGVVAALAFTVGYKMLEQWEMGSSNQKWFTQPLEWTANAIDTVISNPATKVISTFMGGGEAADAKAAHIMTFNKYVAKSHLLDNPNILVKDAMGMSLGQAVVEVTWPFAAGSAGAAIGRNMMLLADNNYKTSWWHNGKIDVGDMLKSTAQEAFRIVTYNVGEDFFGAAIPYLIHRRIANGAANATGIGNIWELQNNSGNTHMVDKDGNLGRSHELMGLLDLQHRFPLYNWYTLMYRDAYNHIGHSFGEWKDNGFAVDFKMPENPVQDAVHSVCESLKYVTKSLIKSQIYMQPSMLFFSPAAIAIGKNDAALMSDATNEFITTQKTYSFDAEKMSQWNAPFRREDGAVPAYNQIAVKLKDVENNGVYYAGKDQVNLNKLVGKDIYEHHSSPLSPVMNPLGKALNCYTNVLHENIAAPMFNAMGLDGHSDDAKLATKTFARAQAAYFPYMMAKYEFAQKWDTPDMDAAIYRALDGITSVNGVELWAGIKDIGKLIALQSPSPETHAKSFEHRGLINSTCEAKTKTAIAQENLKRAEAEERHEKDVPEIVRPLNHIASDIVTGKGDISELQKNKDLLALMQASNIVRFDRAHEGKMATDAQKELALLK